MSDSSDAFQSPLTQFCYLLPADARKRKGTIRIVRTSDFQMPPSGMQPSCDVFTEGRADTESFRAGTRDNSIEEAKSHSHARGLEPEGGRSTRGSGTRLLWSLKSGGVYVKVTAVARFHLMAWHLVA